MSSARFGIIGVAGYVAPRHLAAISAVGGELVVAQDIADHARVLDEHFPDAAFFADIDRMERHVVKELRSDRNLDYVSICSPNHLHDGHVRFALRVGADAICEKPVVINPWNLDLLRDEEARHGQRVWTILQLRLLPKLIELRERVQASDTKKRFLVDVTYVTKRGRWYFTSWKGNEELSGGIATNIGIHLFDLLGWIFGSVRDVRVQVRRPEVIAGTMLLERADVRWFLSVDEKYLPEDTRSGGITTHRSITVDGIEADFTNYGISDLHTATYREILQGNGFGLDDAEPSVNLSWQVRSMPVTFADADVHPLVPKAL